MEKKVIYLLILSLVFVGAVVFSISHIKTTGNQILSIQDENNVKEVLIKNNVFLQNKLNINSGEIIKFKNLDDEEIIIFSDNKIFRKKSIIGEKSIEVQFKKPGIYIFFTKNKESKIKINVN